LTKGNTLVIVSSMDLVHGNSAGKHRMRLYSKAIHSKGNNVFVIHFSTDNVTKYRIDFKNDNLLPNLVENFKSSNFISRIFLLNRIIKSFPQKSSFLLYPTSKSYFDFIFVILTKTINKFKIFYELNEVRKFSITLDSTNISIINSPYKYFKIKYKYLFAVLSEFIYCKYDGFITISNNLLNYKTIEKFRKIRIPILTDYDLKTSKLLIGEGELHFRIGFTGTINIKKENLDVFLHALSKVKNKRKIEFELYGFIDEDNLTKLDFLRKKYNLINLVTYCGEVDGKEVLQLLKKFHLLVLPRGNTLQNQFGFSTKLADYMCSGIPTLVTNVSDNSLYIIDSINGFIIEPDSVEAFINKITYVIDSYSEKASKIAQCALETANKSFNYSNYSSLLTEFLFLDFENKK